MSNGPLLAGWRKRWNRSLLQFLGRRVRTPVDIEDLAQETYLRLLRARDLHDVRNPQAYLLRVASHVLAEWRQDQQHTAASEPVDEELLTDESGPEFEIEADVSSERVNEMLAAASPLMRAVLLLRLRDELPYKEIAVRLEISDRQVKRYLARGYDRLRQALER